MDSDSGGITQKLSNRQNVFPVNILLILNKQVFCISFDLYGCTVVVYAEQITILLLTWKGKQYLGQDVRPIMRNNLDRIV